MRAIFRTFIAFIYLASATLAQAGFLINSYQFGLPPPVLTSIGCTASTTDTNVYTFTDHATGTADPNRTTIVGIGGKDNGVDFSISTVTVGGSSAAEQVDSANAGSIAQTAIYTIANPTGTTATIIVTFPEAIQGAVVCVWSATNLASPTATDFAAAFDTAAGAVNCSLDFAAEGVGVGMSIESENPNTVTWTGMTEIDDGTIDAGNEAEYSNADHTATTAESARSVTADWTGAGDAVCATASFR